MSEVVIQALENFFVKSRKPVVEKSVIKMFSSANCNLFFSVSFPSVQVSHCNLTFVSLQTLNRV
jgi:hypothetical protein